MIRTKTVFVLGAGASAPYGFPLGGQLRSMICDEAMGSSTMSNALKRELNIQANELLRFGHAFAYSLQPSIDAFLARRPDMVDIGKACIAYQLCQKESMGRIHGSAEGDNWYRELWHAMTLDLDSPAQIRNNKVRFVTFNYDRSLEFALHVGTTHTFALDDATAYTHWSQIPICHVYGKIGEFLPGTTSGRPYITDTATLSLQNAAAGLQVIPEARDDAPQFGQARKWFAWAEQICFLGFGYDELNMRRLNLQSVLEWKRSEREEPPKVIASVLGLTQSEIQRRVMPHIKQAASQYLFDAKNLMTLRESGVLG